MSTPYSDLVRDREYRRLNRSILDPFIVRNLNDIRAAISKIDPSNTVQMPDINVSTTIKSGEDTFLVKADTRSRTQREILLEGLESIRKKEECLASNNSIEVNGHKMRPPSLVFGGQHWVDPLIKQWLGGYREGFMICWDIDNYKYEYDIITHKLTRSSK